MQWLINIIKQQVIDMLGIPPCFIDRGDPSDCDWRQDDLAKDEHWHDLDLSSIVPPNATAVLFLLQGQATSAARVIWLKPGDNANNYNASQLKTQVSNVMICQDIAVRCDNTPKIQYWIHIAGWTKITLTVKGWWL